MTKIDCPFCNGRGRDIPYSAQPDPVEGYKMADRVECLACNGHGGAPDGSRLAAGFKAFGEAVEAFDRHLAEVREAERANRRRKRQDALDKVRAVLSPEEIAILDIQETEE